MTTIKTWQERISYPQVDTVKAMVDEIDELRAALPVWRDISTAPKDFVTEFDGWDGERVTNVSWAHPEYSPKGHYDWCVSEYEANYGYFNTAVKGLTHWMPPPQPPETTT